MFNVEIKRASGWVVLYGALPEPDALATMAACFDMGIGKRRLRVKPA